MKKIKLLLFSIILIEFIALTLLSSPVIPEIPKDTSQEDYEKIRDNFDPYKKETADKPLDIFIEPEGPLNTALAPNKSQFSDGWLYKIPVHYVETNSHGLREEEFKTRNPENKKRILFIGDSLTFGAGVNRTYRFTDILEKNLNKNGKEKYQIINAGIPGYGMKDYYLYLKQKGLDYNPDKIILAFSKNDAYWYPKSLEFKREAERQIPENTTNRSEKVKQKREELQNNYLKNLDLNNSDYSKYLNKFDETAREEETPVTYFTVWKFREERKKWLKNWAEKKNRKIILAPEKLQYSAEGHLISEYDAHYNEKGHQIIAQKLYKNLEQNSLFSSLYSHIQNLAADQKIP